MPDRSLDRIFTETRERAAEALEDLSPQLHAIVRRWRSGLRANALPERALEILAKLDLVAGLGQLRAVTRRSLSTQLSSLGEEFAEAGVAIEQALAAFDLLLEECLPHIRHDPAKALAAVRLFDWGAVMLAAGYSQHWNTSQQTLSSQLAETEHRLNGASAYVTQVYERERRRLSHDLHDEIGHDLMLLKLYLEVMKMDAKSRGGQSRAKIEEALSVVGHAIESTRRLVLDLGPAIFDELGFLPAMRFYVQQFSRRTGIHAALQEGAVPEELPIAHQVALYRVLQGALSNVLKHARAKNVKIALGTVRGRSVAMSIEDDGVGFDPARPKPVGSVGLTAIRERVQVLGGRFRIESSRAGALKRSHGTRIEVEVPLPKAGRMPAAHRPRAVKK
ncbi:MAG TPA: sensor histidine kinase [Bryobacteraceae bacterium]|nr:sensor histidine kinase [Bryobacteraceae bacterium]